MDNEKLDTPPSGALRNKRAPNADEPAASTVAAAPQTSEPQPMTEEDLRQFAAERLADHLQIGVDLAGRCEHLSSVAKSDRVAPLYAAARLMTANAVIAKALETYVKLEPRRRLIVERIQTPDAKMIELNSRSQQPDPDAKKKLWRKIEGQLAQAIREGRAVTEEQGRKNADDFLAAYDAREQRIRDGCETEDDDGPWLTIPER